MTLSNSIEELLQYFYQNRQIVVDKSSVKNVTELVDAGVLIELKDDNSKVRINTGHGLLCKNLYEECKSRFKFKNPKDIKDVFAIINDFENSLQKEYNLQQYNRPFRLITDGLGAYLLNILKSDGINVLSIAQHSLSTKSSDQLIDPFEQVFIFHLLNYDYAVDEIYHICQKASQSQNQYLIRNLTGEIFKSHQELLVKLYNYGDGIPELTLCEFQLRIIPAVFDLMPDRIFDKLIVIVSQNPEFGLKLLSESKLSSEQINIAIEISEGLIACKEFGFQLSRLFYSIVSGKSAKINQRNHVYSQWHRLMNDADEKLRASMILEIGLIDNEEDEEQKFGLLINYLALTNDFNVVGNFFYQFKSPKYLYKLLSDIWLKVEGRKSHILKMFKTPIIHFLRSNPVESEGLILEFFNPKYQLGTLPIDIIMLDYPSRFNVDLTKIKDEQVLIGVIHKFYYVTFEFDKLLPTLLNLRYSKYPKVIESLQALLTQLVIESYGEILLNWITDLIGKKEIAFLKPIRQAVVADKNISMKKKSTRELNPYYNEKNNIEQYENLAHENRTQIMSEARNGSGFLTSISKKTTIIRGNSWQHGNCNSEVRPLGHIKSEMTLDSRIYKDPDLLEFQMRNIDK